MNKPFVNWLIKAQELYSVFVSTKADWKNTTHTLYEGRVKVNISTRKNERFVSIYISDVSTLLNDNEETQKTNKQNSGLKIFITGNKGGYIIIQHVIGLHIREVTLYRVSNNKLISLTQKSILTKEVS